MVNFSQFSHPHLECTYDQEFQSTGIHPWVYVQATPLWRRNSWLPAQPKLQQSRPSVYAMNQCICQTALADDWLDLIQFRSVAQSCPTLCNPMDCNIPGLLVHHQLLELTQTHVHWVDEAIQPLYPLSSPSSPAPISPSIRVFSNESILHMRWPKYWSFSFSIKSFQWTPRTDLL